MKNLFVLAFLLVVSAVFGQKALPAVDVKKLDGSSFNIAELGKTGKITIVSFWATWCSPCKKELDAIAEVYEDWQKEYGVELVAVSVDDARSAPKVKPMVEQKGWKYQILLDANQNFQRSLGIQSVPHSFLIDKTGQIVWEHSGYTPGDEVELEEKIKALK